jgi:acyl-CoA synthetase (NDP forming)
MTINYKAIDEIFERALRDGRSHLFEHETYGMLRLAGIRAPKFRFIKRGHRVSPGDLRVFRTPELVLKIVSPLIQHKTDAGGVAFIRNRASDANQAIKKMLSDVPGRYLAWAKKLRGEASSETLKLSEIDREIRGILICERVEYERFGFGTELFLGARNSREFGLIVTFGAGGVEVEYLNDRLKEGRAASIASAHLLRKKNILRHIEPLAVYDKLVLPFRGTPAPLSRAGLSETYGNFLDLAAHYSPFGPSGRYVIEEAEVNPLVIRRGELIPLDGLCRFSRRPAKAPARPFADIRYLLHPGFIAVIGVSERMNLGHIILNNILRQGFPREKVYVVKPGLEEIEGCACVPGVSSLPEAVDLFVLTLAAEQSHDVIRDLIALKKARSVIIIAGGLGEKQGTRGLEERIVGLLDDARARGLPAPVLNGGNCLGIYSKPGGYNTTFVPEYKLSFPKSETSNLVYISQSGAFMISRVGKLQRFEPRYGISLGNQIDLRVSDYLNYLADDKDAKIFAVYMEGFKSGDGYLTAKAVERILRSPDRTVLFYKAGRTPEGRLATASHTASIAGDYMVCRSILEEAGVIVAETVFEFERFIEGLIDLAGKDIHGRRVGLVSNAGFESVIMADSIAGNERLELASFTEPTKKKLAEILAPLGIDRLQDIKNPLDATPVADDAAFCECARAILEDPNVDCAVISPVPMTPAMQTLVSGPGHSENIESPKSTPSRLIDLFRSTAKPFVVNIDAGPDYDPMAKRLSDAGLPVFRRCDEAVSFLRKYVSAKLRIAERYGQNRK